MCTSQRLQLCSLLLHIMRYFISTLSAQCSGSVESVLHVSAPSGCLYVMCSPGCTSGQLSKDKSTHSLLLKYTTVTPYTKGVSSYYRLTSSPDDSCKADLRVASACCSLIWTGSSTEAESGTKPDAWYVSCSTYQLLCLYITQTMQEKLSLCLPVVQTMQ